MKFFKLKTAVSLLLAGMLAVSGCIPAAAYSLSHSRRWEKEWYEEADEWFHAEDDSEAAFYPNAEVFETEEYAFYYPASDAEIRHDGHGNFTVSGLTGGAVSSDDFTAVITPEMEVVGPVSLGIGSAGYPSSLSSWQGAASYGGGTYTASSVPEGSLLGTLTIRGRNIRVYEGTSDRNMILGAGHFTGTSTWNGNLCFAGHNRGSNAWFSDLINLSPGERITYQTTFGTRVYEVTGMRIVSVNDLSPLNGSDRNLLALVTCLANEPDVRLIVTAQETF